MYGFVYSVILNSYNLGSTGVNSFSSSFFFFLVTELIAKAFENLASSTKYFKFSVIILNTRLIIFLQ